jgi:hypothetical protein|tara:strand:+ start:448 stop:1473 length:1026 start_codon:yes stop_codon:yes gene_type:complete
MSEKILISTHTPFQPLKAVLLGQGVSSNFFDWITEDKIKSPLQRIIEETQEDLAFIKKTCEDFGAKVFQDKPLEFDAQLLAHKEAIPSPPIQPRDVHLTLGDKVYCTSTEKVWKYIYDIVDEDCIVNLFNLSQEAGKKFESGETINGASSLKLGNRIIIPSIVDKNMREFSKDFFTKKGYEIVETNDNAHTDGMMSVLKPGVIISLQDIINYEKTFPEWDILHCENQSWAKVAGWLNFKNKSKGRWWVPGEESNEYLQQFVDTWLSKWVGYVEETVFDVNMFSLSEECVLVNNYNKAVFEFLKKHKIEPIICPMRHRYFWDGGLHCFTLDLQREGSKENYF